MSLGGTDAACPSCASCAQGKSECGRGMDTRPAQGASALGHPRLREEMAKGNILLLPAAPRGLGTHREAIVPPCPASAGSRRKARTLCGGSASAFEAASLLVPGSPEQGGRRKQVGRSSKDPPPLATCPAWAASQSPGATGGQASGALAVLGQSDVAQSPVSTSACSAAGMRPKAQPWERAGQALVPPMARPPA